MSDLAIPLIPENLDLQDRMGSLVESDMFNICERVKEVDPRLRIYELPDGGVTMPGGAHYRFSISELCDDGVVRLVYRTAELDGRIIEHLQYLLRVPFDKRFAEAERLEAKIQEEHKEQELGELYERVGRPMLTDLERCGFIQRVPSYAKRGVKP